MTAGVNKQGGANKVELTSCYLVRTWLDQNHRKQLALLDRFLLELRRGRLSQKSGAASSSDNAAFLSQDRRVVTHRTVDLVRHMIGSTKWESPAQLLLLLRGLGRELQAAGGSREPAIGNVVRRIMAAVREEATNATTAAAAAESADNAVSSGGGGGTTPSSSSGGGGRMSLHSMLWTLPQHVKKPNRSSLQAKGSGDHQRQESFADGDVEAEYPPSYYSKLPELKSSVMEAIDEIINDLEDLHKNINEQAVTTIQPGEIILTCGRSRSIELFLKASAAKKRHFQVIVCEQAPHNSGHEMALALSDAGIDTIVVNDSAIFAVMARVNKVLLPAHAVLANGGLIASSGCNLVALAAQHNSVPVVCITGMFKLCPMFPHEGQDTLNDLLSPSSVIDYAEMNQHGLGDVEFINPVHDYIKPEHINLYITNVGSFQPSFIYRLLAEYYHTDDWSSFDD